MWSEKMPRDNESDWKLTNHRAAVKEHRPDFREAGFNYEIDFDEVDAGLIVMLGMTCRQFNRMDEEIRKERMR